MKKNIIALALGLFLSAANSFADEELNYEVVADKLNESRNNLSISTGSSLFSFDQEDINNLPLGQATSLNQVLQRAPGVVTNAQNQIHVRGDHSGLQYRINGMMLPEGINGFGQAFDTHFVDSIDFLTGAMPAQYGFRTSGVVDIKTKDGNFANKNRSEITVGGNDTFGANQQVGGTSGRLSYYVNANYLQNSRGIESTTAARDSINNDTTQDNVFGYFSYLLEPTKKLSVIVSNSNNRYEIPNNPNQSQDYHLDGSTITDSLDLREKQIEANRFAVVALQGIMDNGVDYQLSLFSRYSNLEFLPDYQSLVYSGISSDLDRSSFANGIQGDYAYSLNDKNTLRAGFYAVNDRVKSFSNNNVFHCHEDDDDDHGHGHACEQEEPHVAELVADNSVRDSQFYSLYLQNEWKALESLTLNYGARFDISHAYKNENQLSPRAGLVYDFDKKTKFHAGYSRYFTPPSVAAVSPRTLSSFEGTSNEAEVSQNDPVKAERSHYFDVGVAHKLTPSLTLALDGFYKKSKNYLDEHQFGNSRLYSPFNYGKAKSYGLEFKADYKKEDWMAYLNFSAQRVQARNINSAQYIVHEEEYEYAHNNWVTPGHVQNYSGVIGGAYKIFDNVVAADALFGSGLATGENNKNTMPSYWQVNGSVSRNVKIGNIDKINLRLSVLNAFDEVYQYSNGTGISVNASQFAPRRTYYLIMSKTF
ncbi:MAG: TonB-dependent receptor [Rickettsiales bacterium]|nr:TonB-dependent receptor [Rickettsiales bacterium]